MSQNYIFMRKEKNERDTNRRKFLKFFSSFNKKHFKKGRGKKSTRDFSTWKIVSVSQHPPSLLSWKMKLKLSDWFPPSWWTVTLTCSSFRSVLLERATIFQDTLQVYGWWVKACRWSFICHKISLPCSCTILCWPEITFRTVQWYDTVTLSTVNLGWKARAHSDADHWRHQRQLNAYC